MNHDALTTMFTGIITAIGTVAGIEETGRDKRLHIDAGDLDLSDVATGDSICVSGVCLTVVEADGRGFAADVSTETLSCTTLGRLQKGSRVNLEKALRLGDRLGGHLVSGHTDGTGTVLDVQRDARSLRCLIRAPEELACYICSKGSICVDGVSLTVNDVTGADFGVNIIPHTAAVTTFHDCAPGDTVNLEVDIIARYLERLNPSRT
jgi:riboflavin synthase